MNEISSQLKIKNSKHANITRNKRENGWFGLSKEEMEMHNLCDFYQLQ